MKTRKEVYAIGMHSKFGGDLETWRKNYQNLEEKKKSLDNSIKREEALEKSQRINHIETRGINLYFRL